MPVAPRIVNDVSYVTGINHASPFFVAGAVFEGWRVSPVAVRIVTDV